MSEPQISQHDASELIAASNNTLNIIKTMDHGSAVLPIFIIVATKNDALKKQDPEKYYNIKASLRELIMTLEKQIPELKKSLEKMI